MTNHDDKTSDIAAEATRAAQAAAAASTLKASGASKRAATPDAAEEPPAKKAHTVSAVAQPASVPALPKANLSPRPAMNSVSPTLNNNNAIANRAADPPVPIAPAPPRASTPSLIAASPPTVPTSPKAASDKKTSSSSSNLRGLRHFSMMVCKKVEEKGTTTYNEVADELVQQVLEDRQKEDPTDNSSNKQLDEKNIRRRVYDALNVLMAMEIIAKDKKEITWKGLPTVAHHNFDVLEREQAYRQEQVQAKRRALQEILVQQVCFRNLVKHNQTNETPQTKNTEKIPLPFIVVNTHKEAVINCNMNPDMNDVMLDFDRPFEINDDNSILTRLGMHKTNLNVLRDMVPQDLLDYCQQHGLLNSVLRQSSKGGNDSPPPIGLTSSGSNKGHFFTSLE